MELLLIYLWLKLDALQSMFISAAVVLAAGSAFTLLVAYLNDDSRLSKWALRGAIACVTLVPIATAIPSSRDAAILVGASYALDLAKSPEGAKVGTLLRGKVNEVLDSEIAKLKKGG